MEKAEACRNLEIIGFDFGHGESAVALTMGASMGEPKILEVAGSRSFITAVAGHPTRGVLIGREAYATRDATHLQIAFKSPHLDRIEVRNAIASFFSRTMEMLASERKVRNDGNTLVVVGCPSGWSPATRSTYADLLRGAGRQQNVQLTAESRAAFLCAREDGLLGFDWNTVCGSALIVDIGSSTTDFTVVLRLKEQYIDFGDNRLGAGLIETTIFKRALQRHERRGEHARPVPARRVLAGPV